MVDATNLTHRGEVAHDNKIDKLDLRRRRIETVLPAHFVDDYPDFVKFLALYYEYLEADEGLDKLIERLRDVRNIDIAEGDNIAKLKEEYGQGFPDIETMNDGLALHLFEWWYQSKGNKDAIEAYFRIFLNDEAEVVFPKDNILKVSDGNWNETRGQFEDSQGLISETTMVIQDSYYYQQFSYLIKSGLSIADWGDSFRNVAHPAGWNLFGEVHMTELAQFEQFRTFTRSGTRSPTYVAGTQTRDSSLIILGAALAIAIGQFAVSGHPMKMSAHQRHIIKSWKLFSVAQEPLSLQDANKNLFLSTYTLGHFKDHLLKDFLPENAPTIKPISQRPARIEIT